MFCNHVEYTEEQCNPLVSFSKNSNKKVKIEKSYMCNFNLYIYIYIYIIIYSTNLVGPSLAFYL